MAKKDDNKKTDGSIPSPFNFVMNPLSGEMEEMTAEKIKHVEDILKKVKTKGLPPKDLEEIAKKMNCPAVVVVGFPTGISRGVQFGEFQFNAVGIDKDMTVPTLDFIAQTMKHGFGQGNPLKNFDIQVDSLFPIPPHVKERIVKDLIGKLKRGEIKLHDGHAHGLGSIKNDMADAMRGKRVAMGIDSAIAGGDKTAINLIKHPQRTPFWKRVLNFFKRPRFSEENLERGTVSNLKLPSEKEINEISKGIENVMNKNGLRKVTGADKELCACGIPKDGHSGRHNATHYPDNKGATIDVRPKFVPDENNTCPVCRVPQRGGVSAHIRSKAMWEKRKGLSDTPYTDFMGKWKI